MQKFKSILLVDDDDATNFLHSFSIKDWGYADKIYTTLNGQEALDFLKTNEEFKNNEPSLILLDVNMPVMNGFEFMEAYEHLDPSLKASVVVVMLSSSLHPKDQERAGGQKDLNSFINKPLSKEQMEILMSQIDLVKA